MDTQRLVVGISGASGAPLAVELLRQLRCVEGLEIHLVCSRWGLATVQHETGLTAAELEELCYKLYSNEDCGSPPASGSFQTLGMAVVPCSMKTLAGIVTGYSDSLLLRAADVTLKERRRLVLVPRECPLSTLHLRNLCTASELGATILPPVPAYYEHPETIQDIDRHLAAKILQQFGLPGGLREWEGL